jgi:chemotaxis protein MotB
MTFVRRLAPLALAFVFAGSTAGCGHSEEEWQQKLKEIEELNNRLNKTGADKKKCDDDLARATDDIANLRGELAKATGQAGDLSKQADEQRRLIDRLKREKEQLDAIKARFDQLKRKLESLTRLGLNVTVRNNRMVIQLPGDLLFESGRTDLKADGRNMLEQVAEVIGKDAGLASRTYQVAGHTDNKPYGGQHIDNWGLSLMRAREVTVYLTGVKGAPGKKGGGGLDAKRWSAAGYGENDPITPNDTDDNRRKNRRVELVVLPNVEEMIDLQSLTR